MSIFTGTNSAVFSSLLHQSLENPQFHQVISSTYGQGSAQTLKIYGRESNRE